MYRTAVKLSFRKKSFSFLLAEFDRINVEVSDGVPTLQASNEGCLNGLLVDPEPWYDEQESPPFASFAICSEVFWRGVVGGVVQIQIAFLDF